MPTSGITNKGFFNKWIFGPGLKSDIITNQSCVKDVPGYTNLIVNGPPQDLIYHNLELRSELLPTYYISGAFPTDPRYSTFKIRCSGTLTLNPYSFIRVDGDIINTSPTFLGHPGYGLIGSNSSDEPYGTLGGSGGGGNGSLTTGLSGKLATAFGIESNFTHLGGSGGHGGAYNGQGTGGVGGAVVPNSQFTSVWNPSVWQEAVIHDYRISTGEGIGTYGYMVPYKICGGGGGGGAGGVVLQDAVGGGGCGGGVCYIAANKIVFNGGIITADGGTGGYGGGGGGGVVIIVASTIEWNVTDISGGYVRARGGVGGSGGATDGTNGTILVFTDDLVAQFNGTLNPSDYASAVAAYNKHE